ncbi:MAG: hypothetical protein AAGD96_00475 [Chloroflexota bacterium]
MAKKKYFKDKFTNDPEEATNLLLEEALENLAPVSEKFLENQFISLHRTWGAEKMVRGKLKKIKPFILSNLQTMSQDEKFSQFKVGLFNKGAQITVIRSDGFKSLRIWKAEADLAACGDQSFEVQEKKWWEIW